MHKAGMMVGLLFAFVAGGCNESGKTGGVTDANFEREVLQSDLPVLVDFWGEG
jgi:thioredoxin-like negative regulator of GroEL